MYSMDSIKRRSRHFSEGGAPKSPYAEDTQYPIHLTLQGNELVYENGVWNVNGTTNNKSNIPGSGIDKKKLDVLQRENEELKFKVDTLLNLLTVTKLDLLEALGQK
eukprot:NODE_363_length_8763_cov_0.834718.p8 type:complete len:106 gc:universal NODE_363_length_8763_cov_0.834718:8374-8057(-)